jgi:hypothetical protein
MRDALTTSGHTQDDHARDGYQQAANLGVVQRLAQYEHSKTNRE